MSQALDLSGVQQTLGSNRSCYNSLLQLELLLELELIHM